MLAETRFGLKVLSGMRGQIQFGGRRIDEL